MKVIVVLLRSMVQYLIAAGMFLVIIFIADIFTLKINDHIYLLLMGSFCGAFLPSVLAMANDCINFIDFCYKAIRTAK